MYERMFGISHAEINERGRIEPMRAKNLIRLGCVLDLAREIRWVPHVDEPTRESIGAIFDVSPAESSINRDFLILMYDGIIQARRVPVADASTVQRYMRRDTPLEIDRKDFMLPDNRRGLQKIFRSPPAEMDAVAKFLKSSEPSVVIIPPTRATYAYFGEKLRQVQGQIQLEMGEKAANN
ncbi:MAG: hypothetical protein AAB553_00900 [Patescibacteria group bacterium]